MSDAFNVVREHIEKAFDSKVSTIFKDRDAIARLSIGLAAYAVFKRANTNEAEAVEAVVDGRADYGIDAFHYDSVSKILFIVQSKINQSTSKGVGKGDVLKFLEGVGKILNGDLEGFNKRMVAKEDQVTQFLSTTDGTVSLILISTGLPLEPEIQESFDAFCASQNSTEQEWVKFEHLELSQIKDLILEDKTPKKINVRTSIHNWSEVKSPIRCVYGQIPATEIGTWFGNHGTALFGDNIRVFLGNISDNNKKIESSLLKAPDQFFFLNNGLTILCDDINFTRATVNSHERGDVEVTNLKIVNGAQTTGSIGSVFKRTPEAIKNTFVMARIVSLKGMPTQIGSEITVATNSQTRIDAMDFVAIDIQQIRLEKDCLRENGYYYLRQRGSRVSAETQISPEEVAAALVSASAEYTHHVNFKRNPGAFWSSYPDAPYSLFFNETLLPQKAINSVLVLREVQKFLQTKRDTKSKREKTLTQTGDLLLTFLIFRSFKSLEKDLVSPVEEFKSQILPQIAAIADGHFQALWAELSKKEYESTSMSRLLITSSKVKTLIGKVVVEQAIERESKAKP